MGWTIPGGGACYWVGEAMGNIDFKDLPQVPEKVQQTADMLASNAAHLAGLLKKQPYPGVSKSPSEKARLPIRRHRTRASSHSSSSARNDRQLTQFHRPEERRVGQDRDRTCR